MHHAVQGVEGGGDGERPQALPPGVGRLVERGQLPALRFGRGRSQRRALKRGRPVALAGLQELPGRRVGLEEAEEEAGDAAAAVPLPAGSAQGLLRSFKLPRAQQQAGCRFTGYLYKLWLSYVLDMFSVTNSECKITNAELTVKFKLV